MLPVYTLHMMLTDSSLFTLKLTIPSLFNFKLTCLLDIHDFLHYGLVSSTGQLDFTKILRQTDLIPNNQVLVGRRHSHVPLGQSLNPACHAKFFFIGEFFYQTC